MCGIIAMVGRKPTAKILVEGLKRLEYRGYDSAGIAIRNGGGLSVRKCAGKIRDLEALLSEDPIDGETGIAHTRWATHGAPNSTNAHPHYSCDHKVVLVHNGIIENHQSLKSMLLDVGHHFETETDTEVLAHLVEYYYKGNLEEAVQEALKIVKGTYGIAAMHEDEPGKIVGARNGSPLVVGLGNDEFFIASDVAAILSRTRQVIYLDDGEMVVIDAEGYRTLDIQNQSVDKSIHEITWNLDQIEKGGYPHFMLKEIHEQSQTIEDTYRGRLLPETGEVKLGGLADFEEPLMRCRRFIILGCGTSWHAGLVGEYMIEEYAHIPVEVEYASEFR